MYGILADVSVVAHLAFVGFVGLGGALVLRWNWLAWVHVPSIVWAVLVEWLNLVCPLTLWEQRLRELAGQSVGLNAEEGGFIAHYLVPLLYPPGLTRPLQIALGALVITINVAVYARLWHLRRGLHATSP